PIVLPTQLAQDLLDISQAELGVLAYAELRFDILRVIEQDTACLILVSTSTPGFLKIVFHGTWDISMHDQTNIRLIHAHAKSIGRNNYLELSRLEGILNIRLFVGLKSRVKMAARPTLTNQETREVLGTLATGNENHRPAVLVIEMFTKQ